MAWGYWSATAVDRGRSPRRNTQCTVMPINTVPQSEPPAPTCYSPCRSSRCSSPSCQGRNRKCWMARISRTLLKHQIECILPIISPLHFFNASSVATASAQCQDSQCHCIDDSPPPHSVISQQCPIDGGNGNGGASGIINDEYSRRQSIDRLDSPQVTMQIEHVLDELEFSFRYFLAITHLIELIHKIKTSKISFYTTNPDRIQACVFDFISYHQWNKKKFWKLILKHSMNWGYAIFIL